MTTQTTEWTNPPDLEDDLRTWLDDMRERDPVQRDTDRGGWHVFGHAEATDALNEHGALSSVVGVDLPDDSPLQIFRVGNLSWMDPPRHDQLRALLRPVFTPRYMASLQTMIEETVDRVLGNIEGRDEFLFSHDYAAPIASSVIGEMLGIPLSDRGLFRKWTNALMSLADPNVQTNGVGTLIGFTRDIKLYLEALVRNRHRVPKDDFITRLTAAEVDGQTLTDEEIRGLITLFLLTGQTTTQTLNNAITCLEQNRDAERELRANPSLIPTALEEVMRYRAQTSRVARITTKPVQLGGHWIPAGQPVSVWLAAANFDPKKFADPYRFDIHRTPNPHIALGHGVHFCLGAPLSRMESAIALQRFLARTKSFEVDHERTTMLDPRLVFGAQLLMVKAVW